MRLWVVPLTLEQANTLVLRWHRHHKPTVGARFSLGVVDDGGGLRGAAICGRPVARKLSPYDILEVTRLVTDGTANACSILYAASARAARAMGFRRIQTYILESEPGTSLIAAGWQMDAVVEGRPWVHTAGPRRQDQPNGDKTRWVKLLDEERPDLVLQASESQAEQLSMKV